jgi:hypothetical protein
MAVLLALLPFGTAFAMHGPAWAMRIGMTGQQMDCCAGMDSHDGAGGRHDPAGGGCQDCLGSDCQHGISGCGQAPAPLLASPAPTSGRAAATERTMSRIVAPATADSPQDFWRPPRAR